ncbi:MAG: restriction endonuclease subunit S, partial [Rhodoferax sp.]|nr:restriction endonuclease subunit S [Rhodoferax sp.]
MEMRAGYKQTEVGVIPIDWQVKRIGELALVGSGGTPSRKNPAYWGGSIPWVTTSQIDFGSIESADQFISELGLENSAAKLLPKGTLLLALYGQGKTRGKVAVLGIEAATNQACASISLSSNVSRDYVLHFLVSRYEALRNASNSGSQENLNAQIVKDFPVVCPPPFEQRAIATALSDVDALLAKIDQLIAKKRDLKQAAMQQLLTGQTRLPGFSGEWEVKRLGDVLKVRHGRSQHEVERTDGIYPILASGGEIGRTNTFLYDKPSVLIGRKGTIDRPRYQDKPFWTVDTLFYTELSGKAQPKFIYYKFLMIDWRSYNEASGVPSLNASTIEAIEIVAPGLAEQIAIATVLSDMDAELTALEARRDKTRALKQGMMQA